MRRPVMLTTAAAFALASSVAVADDAPAPKAASKPVPKSRTHRAAAQLPPGLPRAGYRYRTTVVAPAPRIAPAAPYRQPPLPETDDALLITPAYGPEAYTQNLPGTP